MRRTLGDTSSRFTGGIIHPFDVSLSGLAREDSSLIPPKTGAVWRTRKGACGRRAGLKFRLAVEETAILSMLHVDDEAFIDRRG